MPGQADGTGQTRMTLRNRGEPAGFSNAHGAVRVPGVRRANQKDLAALKTRLEGGAA